MAAIRTYELASFAPDDGVSAALGYTADSRAGVELRRHAAIASSGEVIATAGLFFLTFLGGDCTAGAPHGAVPAGDAPAFPIQLTARIAFRIFRRRTDPPSDSVNALIAIQPDAARRTGTQNTNQLARSIREKRAARVASTSPTNAFSVDDNALVRDRRDRFDDEPALSKLPRFGLPETYERDLTTYPILADVSLKERNRSNTSRCQLRAWRYFE